MKKLFVCLCAGVLLAGCSGGSKEKVTKTCSMEQSGNKMSMNLDAEGDTVTNAVVQASVAYEGMGVTKEMVDALPEEQKKEFEETLIDEMGLAGDDSVEVKAEFTDTEMVVKMTYNVGALEKTFNATSLEEMLKEAESMGMTCK